MIENLVDGNEKAIFFKSCIIIDRTTTTNRSQKLATEVTDSPVPEKPSETVCVCWNYNPIAGWWQHCLLMTK